MKKKSMLVVINISKIKDGIQLGNHFPTKLMNLRCLAGNISFFLKSISVKHNEILSFQIEQKEKLEIVLHVSSPTCSLWLLAPSRKCASIGITQECSSKLLVETYTKGFKQGGPEKIDRYV